MAFKKDIEAENHINRLKWVLDNVGISGFNHSSPEEIRNETVDGFPVKARLAESLERVKVDSLLAAAEHVGTDELDMALAEIRYVLELDPDNTLARTYEQEISRLVSGKAKPDYVQEPTSGWRNRITVVVCGLAIAVVGVVVGIGL